jgi:hypothetical protein
LIPRVHAFELEDQSWFPTTIRDLATDYLEFVERTFHLHKPIVPLLADALRTSSSRQVIDLCSGGAGPVIALAGALASEGLDVSFTLTDRFPNLPAFERAAANGSITYASESVDARRVPRHLRGFRTLFNCFHHFAPDDAVAVLRDAVDARQPIGIFEIPERAVATVASMVLTPVMVVLGTPFVRPFRWRRLWWTYVIPLVPLTCLWDGIISQFRAYTVNELEELTRDPALSTYVWRAGRVPIPSTPAHVTYLIGRPR